MSAKSMPYKPYSLSFWRAYLVTMRPYLLFVSGAAGLAGLAIPDSLPWTRLAAAFAAFTLTYGLGQALTDVFQTDTDSISSPYRPLTQGVITRAQVLAVSLAGLAACAAVFVWCNPLTLPLCVAEVLGLASYTWFKRRWWGGPFWNSWIVALLPVIGVLCGGEGWAYVAHSGRLWCVAVSAFFGYAVFVLLGYLKDISADRKTGYRTLPVTAGWRATIWVSGLYALLALVAGAYVFGEVDAIEKPWGPAEPLALMFWGYAAVMFWLAHSGLYLNRAEDESKAHGPISHSVRAFIALMLAEAIVIRPDLWLVAAAYYLLFELALSVRPEKTQV